MMGCCYLFIKLKYLYGWWWPYKKGYELVLMCSRNKERFFVSQPVPQIEIASLLLWSNYPATSSYQEVKYQA